MTKTQPDMFVVDALPSLALGYSLTEVHETGQSGGCPDHAQNGQLTFYSSVNTLEAPS